MPERKTINGELCERVTDPGALRKFDVVYTACDHCPGKYHRGWLTRRARSLYGGWVMDPTPARHAVLAGFFVVRDSSVPDGYIWRVVDEARDDDGYQRDLTFDEAAARMLAIAQPIRKVTPAELDEKFGRKFGRKFGA